MSDPTTIWVVTQGLARHPVLWRMTDEDAGAAIRSLDHQRVLGLEAHQVSENPALTHPAHNTDFLREAAALSARLYAVTGYATTIHLYVHPSIWHSLVAGHRGLSPQGSMSHTEYMTRRFEVYPGVFLLEERR